jgi:hypothetical protein
MPPYTSRLGTFYRCPPFRPRTVTAGRTKLNQAAKLALFCTIFSRPQRVLRQRPVLPPPNPHSRPFPLRRLLSSRPRFHGSPLSSVGANHHSPLRNNGIMEQWNHGSCQPSSVPPPLFHHSNIPSFHWVYDISTMPPRQPQSSQNPFFSYPLTPCPPRSNGTPQRIFGHRDPRGKRVGWVLNPRVPSGLMPKA